LINGFEDIWEIVTHTMNLVSCLDGFHLLKLSLQSLYTNFYFQVFHLLR
jgi:hypothetical protein